MKIPTALLPLASLLLALPARGAECEPKVSLLAIRLSPASAMSRPLTLALGGKPFLGDPEQSSHPKLAGLWIFRSSAYLGLEDLKGLAPVADCLGFALRTPPKVDRLEDGSCYGIFEYQATFTCWSVRVKSVPYGYPFQVVLEPHSERGMRIESDADDNWNLEKDLPRSRAIVEIYEQVDKPKRRLLAIDGVTVVRLRNDPEASELGRDQLVDYVDVSSNFNNPMAEDARREARRRRMSEDPDLKRLKKIVLAAEGER
jgi:hypothetical protein